MPTINDLIEHAKSFGGDTSCAYSLWLPEDVLSQDDEVTEEEAAEVLESMHECHNPEYGLTWGTVYQVTQDVIDDRFKGLDKKVRRLKYDLRNEIDAIYREATSSVKRIRPETKQMHGHGYVLYLQGRKLQYNLFAILHMKGE